MSQKPNKVRVSVTKEIILISTELGIPSRTRLIPGKEVKMTAKEIFDQMSKDPASLMPMNPTAKSLSVEEKNTLDELFTLLKDASLKTDNIDVAKNCLEILSAPFGLLHQKREEAVEVIIEATKIPELSSFANRLIEGSKKMLRGSLLCGDKETEEVAENLLKLIERNNIEV